MSTGKWFQIKKEATEAARLREERQQRSDIEAKYREASARVEDLEERLVAALDDADAYRAEGERTARELDAALKVIRTIGEEVSAAGFVTGDRDAILSSVRAMRVDYERLRDGRDL